MSFALAESVSKYAQTILRELVGVGLDIMPVEISVKVKWHVFLLRSAVCAVNEGR